MSHRADPERIEAARRIATIARLVSAGELPDRAEAWVTAWESATPPIAGRRPWDRFDEWLAAARRDQRRSGP